MGVEILFICKTCRKSVYVGKNLSVRAQTTLKPCYDANHEVQPLSDEHVYEKNVQLWHEGGPETGDWVIVTDYGEYTHEDQEDI